jgi:hypothetical protein
MQPHIGIHTGMSNQEYQRLDAISGSQIKLARSSMLDWKRRYLDGIEENRDARHFAVGDLLHCTVLDPHTFDSRFIVTDKIDGRTTETKRLLAQAHSEDKHLVSTNELAMIRQMAQAIADHPAAGQIFFDGTPELVAIASDEPTGRLLKVRVDYLRLDRFGTGIAFELKSARDASLDGFRKAISSLGYHISAALYLDVLNRFYGGNVRDFYFVVVEKEQPYKVAIYQLSERAIEQGRLIYRAVIDRMQRAATTQYYPSYNNDQPVVIDLPVYAYRLDEEELEIYQ